MRDHPVVFVIVLLIFAVAALSWVSFVHDALSVTSRQGVTVVEGFQLDDPAWQHAFIGSLTRLLNPAHLLSLLLPWHFLVLGGTAAGAAWLWSGLSRGEGPASKAFGLLLAVLPLAVGVGMVPWEIRSLFGLMAEAGLSSIPELVGAGVAEAFAPAGAGLLLTLIMPAVFLGLTRLHHSQMTTQKSSRPASG